MLWHFLCLLSITACTCFSAPTPVTFLLCLPSVGPILALDIVIVQVTVVVAFLSPVELS